MIYLKRLIFLLLITTSCQSTGQLKVEADIAQHLKEVSAVETSTASSLIWTIEDSGNRNQLVGLNAEGTVINTITITNAKNEDWEDLTADDEGNIYIGDFGNNNEKRKIFRIYKVKFEDLDKTTAIANIIEFELPKKQDSKDFEAFFLYQNYFYIFSKEHKKFLVLKVPNIEGKHLAKIHSDYKLDGKNNKITSADLSDDGKTIVLLNHDKLWKLSGFKGADFFSGHITELPFEHKSQKEGICFKNNAEVLITDERRGTDGGNIYSFNLN
ncbi:MAG: SdiA-regulated domain-containing protein [Winogradskyella sp.]|uniref:SdiA-regulated domain-containing protein n=1 Tax=Winogradskyella sp. TaxID=1883156 RepID=UPI003859B02B